MREADHNEDPSLKNPTQIVCVCFSLINLIIKLRSVPVPSFGGGGNVESKHKLKCSDAVIYYLAHQQHIMLTLRML